MIKLIRKRIIFILIMVGIWEAMSQLGFFPPILFPSTLKILTSLVKDLASGELIMNTAFSFYLIISGLLITIVLTVILSTLAVISKTFDDFLDTAVAVMNPLPGIALLPLALIWFGIGQKPIIFIIVHATLWPMILNAVTGFKTVPLTLKEVGQNMGLTGPRLVLSIMVPASFPYLLAGLKIGWSRSWRALIAAEMVFGTAGVVGGLGWYIYKQRFMMEVSGVFAALIVIGFIGILVEDLLFGWLERITIKRWGMTI
jgi:NitT/TauT family transport system permease protein